MSRVETKPPVDLSLPVAKTGSKRPKLIAQHWRTAVLALGVVLLFAAGVLLGTEYNVLSPLHLPHIPVDESSLTTGGLIALVAIVLATLLAAIAGGKQGTHYHRKIDRTGGIER